MKHRTNGSYYLRVAGALLGLVIAAYVVYSFGVSRGRELSSRAALDGPAAALKAGDVDPSTGRRVLYWHDPMVPGQRFDQPGQSPFMNMKLVPVYEGYRDSSGVDVSPRVRQNLGIRTTEVTRQQLAPSIAVAGNVVFNERDQVIVQARAMAFVEALNVRATLDRVSKGQALAALYVPEWVAGQEELLALRRMSRADADLVDAARHRLRQSGMTDEQIDDVEQRGTVQSRITLRAPIDGVVVDLTAREGMTVAPGDTLFRINGLSTVWVNAAVPESQAAYLRPGAAAQVRSPAVAGTEFRGTVQAILPDVDVATRTIRARIELDNRDQVLVPGMFVNVTLGTEGADVLAVPTEAVIRTGTRTVVIVEDDSGAFRPVDIETGAEVGGQTEIRQGLDAGQRVVVSGQFLLDSEASLRATSTRMQNAPPSTSPPNEHQGEGRITAIGNGKVTLSHGPIPTMQWGSMTMEFILPPGTPPDLRIEEQVRFAFTMGDDGKPQLTRIEPAGRTQ